MARSIWNGSLAVGELRVPVKLFGAIEDRGVHFHEVHAKEGARLEHRRFDPGSGREVAGEALVKGFEVGDGEYVVLSDDELRGVDGRHAKQCEIEQFVPAEQVDPVWYDKPYHLGPRDGSDDGYALLHAALAKVERVGIGRIVLRTREQLVALRALPGGVLGLSTLRFADEVVAPESLDPPADARAPGARERRLAEALVEALSEPFDATDYDDDHRAALLALIERKAEGEAIEQPEREPAEAPDDLSAALDATLAELARRRRRTRGAHGASGSSRRTRGGHAPRRGASSRTARRSGTRRRAARRRARRS
ncbi:Ku protein [Conexibacter sp. JD483]|uniref:non-homologous end joining protein Ku n=1 Tax=unclassified Conexibacter TaxID=2627773 RepID=UPI002725DC8A|nr:MULTISPECIES: Ku protein [unclassified Conexibacter]MDO8188995.1 Ku protein [Conexibacter sp. CPCC 205706]MDO8201793.1 Ku protein [Conexibacter sp. CPCC 205762]MDR9371518.1 Ku protein [Conexibacter sp. JD483]